MNAFRPLEVDVSLQTRAIRILREQGFSKYQIATALGCSLSTVRIALDSHAAECHERWSGAAG